MSVIQVVTPFLELGLLVALAPLFAAAVRRVEARLTGHAGPSLLEPYARLNKLLANPDPGPPSRLSDGAVALGFAATITATGLIPAATSATPLGAAGGVVAFAGLLALARLCHAAAAFDSEHCAAPRGVALNAYVAALTEPALVLALFALTLASGTGELGPMAGLALDSSRSPLSPARLLAGAALLLVALSAAPGASSSRARAGELDPPALAQLAGQQGPRRALLELSGWIREVALWTLFVNLMLPFGLATDAGLAAFGVAALTLTIKLAAVATGVGLARSTLARLRLARPVELAGAAFALATLALVFAETKGA